MKSVLSILFALTLLCGSYLEASAEKYLTVHVPTAIPVFPDAAPAGTADYYKAEVRFIRETKPDIIYPTTDHSITTPISGLYVIKGPDGRRRFSNVAFIKKSEEDGHYRIIKNSSGKWSFDTYANALGQFQTMFYDTLNRTLVELCRVAEKIFTKSKGSFAPGGPSLRLLTAEEIKDLEPDLTESPSK